MCDSGVDITGRLYMPVTLRGQKVKYSTEKILSLFGRITLFGAKCFPLAVNKTLILRVRGSPKKKYLRCMTITRNLYILVD